MLGDFFRSVWVQNRTSGKGGGKQLLLPPSRDIPRGFLPFPSPARAIKHFLWGQLLTVTAGRGPQITSAFLKGGFLLA